MLYERKIKRNPIGCIWTWSKMPRLNKANALIIKKDYKGVFEQYEYKYNTCVYVYLNVVHTVHISVFRCVCIQQKIL